MNSKKIVNIVIPARLKSTRLPNKVLLKIRNKTILEIVYEKAKLLEDTIINKVFIAVDSKEVFNEALKFCPQDNIIFTSDQHDNGTSRLSEVSTKIESDFLINLQADEPLINIEVIQSLVESIYKNKGVGVFSVYKRIENSLEFESTNTVKVVLDKNNFAMYFSRSKIPNIDRLKNSSNVSHAFKHIGIYAYNMEFLKKYQSLLQDSILGEVESLEQLTFLESGIKIKMVETAHDSIGVDTYEDYLKVKELIDKEAVD